MALTDNVEKMEVDKINSCMKFCEAANIWFNQYLCDFEELWRTFCETSKIDLNVGKWEKKIRFMLQVHHVDFLTVLLIVDITKLSG